MPGTSFNSISWPFNTRVFNGLAPPVAPPGFFEDDLVTFLSSRGFVVYPGQIPQGASLPAVTFKVIDSDRDAGLSGPSGIVRARVELEVSSPSYIDCGRACERLRRLLARIRYPMGNTYVDACLLDDEHSDFLPPVDSSDVGVHVKASDFLFRYHEFPH